MKQQRLARVLSFLEAQGLSQMIVTDPPSMFYLTGRWISPGERMLALYISASGKHHLVVNRLFPQEELGIPVHYYDDTQDPVKLLAQLVEKQKPLGVDKTWPARFLLRLMALGGGSSFVDASLCVDQARSIKDEEEQQAMRRASLLADDAVRYGWSLLEEGLTEAALWHKLDQFYLDHGAQQSIGSDSMGPNTADPHHLAQPNYALQPGDGVLMDIGCQLDFYCSDTTRTIFFRSASPLQQTVYDIVREANLRAIDAVKPGVPFCAVDTAARDLITAQGYGPHFVHRTGHSIGIQCHDFGDVSSTNTDLIQPGMIFSIEPGIYLPGQFGVRIEDLVLVTETGCEVLNHLDKNLHIL